MVRPTATTINCPQCGQPFNAFIEQILDVSVDPTVKERLLAGRINLITCPHCGYRGAVRVPLFYHDPAKQLALVYVPMELNLQQAERERLIGSMTNAVMRTMPEDAPKGYLLQPGTPLTMQGLIELILEADGITPEMINAERRKVELVNLLANAGEEERQRLLEENRDILDLGFLELLEAAAQAASQQGDQRTALRLLNTRSQLMETTEAGRELKARRDALLEASEELKALGEAITREKFVDLLVKSADNPLKIDAFATLGQALLDYSTFQVLSERIEGTQDEARRQRLIEVRERLLAIAAEYERQARAVIERAVDTLRMLLQAGDVRTAIRNNLDRIDETFLQVLQANLEEARRTGNVQAYSRLKQIRDEVLALMQAAAPPEVRLINELLAAEDDSASLEVLRAHRDEINEQFLQLMDGLAEQLRSAGNELAAQRLNMIHAEAEKMLAKG